MQIIIGLIAMLAGGVITFQAEKIYNTFGPMEFFEKFLGTEGGSRLGYKLVGLFTFFIGLLIMTGMIQGFVYWIFGPLIRVSVPQ